MNRKIAKQEVNKEKRSFSRATLWYMVIWQQFCEYCGHTALHGYQYLTEPGRHVLERLLWLSVHCCAITGASLMIHSAWRRYEDSPTATAVESTHYPVWNLPFPAVTICDPNQVQTSSARRLANRMSSGNKALEDELFNDMRHLRQLLKHGTVPFSNVSRLHGSLSKTGLSIEEIMRELSPSCSDLLAMCRWKGEDVPCSTLFHISKSDNGFCCSFNFASCHGRTCNHTSKGVPQHVTSAGHRYGLMVLIKYRLEERYAATISTGAMRVLLHTWFEFPGQWAAAEALVRRQSHTFFRVTAESTYATEALRNLGIHKSGCVFGEVQKNSEPSSDESSSTYSQDNCLVECRRKHVLRLCGCQPYYYPGSGTGRLCDLSDIACLARYKGLLSRLKPPRPILGLEADGQEAMDCTCSPPCQELTYRYEATSGELLLDHYADIGESNNLFDSSNYSLFYVFFGRMTGTRYRRDVLFSWDTLLSNAGGLCGLFMGFSLISIVEIVYFFTIRLVLMVKRRGQVFRRRREGKSSPRAQHNLTLRKIGYRAFPPLQQDSHFLWADMAPLHRRRIRPAYY